MDVFIQIFLGLAALYFYASAPRFNGIEYMKDFMGRYYAHRGLQDNSTESPENSLEAFRLAVAENYGIELDVQLTKDEIPVVFHDRALGRVCGIDKPVSEFTLKELQGYRLFESKQTIPTLKEALEAIGGKVPIIVELKVFDNEYLRVCEKSQMVLDQYHGLYCVESFHPFAILWYKKNHPKILRGQLSLDYMKDRSHGLILDLLLDNLLFNFLTKPSFIAYNHVDIKKLQHILSRTIFKSCIVAYTVTNQTDLDMNIDFFQIQIFEGFNPKKH